MKTRSLFLWGTVPLLGMLCFFQPLCAQEEGFFADPVEVSIEFGIDITPTEANLALPTLVDIDGDGDLDLFYSSRVLNTASSCWESTAFDYYQNQGSDECPEFVKLPGAPFGLPDDIAVSQFVDIDADGDLDLYSSDHCYSSTISYYENTGSATAPAFGNTPTISYPLGGILFGMITFGDLDNDGDYDGLINGIRPGVFLYLENTGTPTQPQFTVPEENPFGLEVPPPNGSEWSLLADWDCDGDLDVLNSHLLLGSSHNTWLLYYHENAGTPESPGFLPPVFTGDTLVAATLGDLDGDGDLDIVSDEYFYRNISQPKGCVTAPVAGFTYAPDPQTDLTVVFSNQSTAIATGCREAKWMWDFGDGFTSEEENPVHTYSSAGAYTVRLVVADVAGSDTLEQLLDIVSGLRNESIQSHFLLYPNPAVDFIYLEPKNGGTFSGGIIEVYDILGRRVRGQNVNPGGDIRIDVEGLSAGNYLLKAFWEGRLLTGHFVKAGMP